jgi:hypothetical protein
MPQSGHGRGRGKHRNQLLADSYDFIPSPIPVVNSGIILPKSSPTIDGSESESGFSSASSSAQSSISSQRSIPKGRGRGRGAHLKQNVVPDDPHWTVTNLTDAQFKSISRPKKPDELGTLGQQVQVIANYFPILQFPHKGFVYKYHIQIRNRKKFEIPRDRRR